MALTFVTHKEFIEKISVDFSFSPFYLSVSGIIGSVVAVAVVVVAGVCIILVCSEEKKKQLYIFNIILLSF